MDRGGWSWRVLGAHCDHLFAEVWSREGLSLRDRRLLLIGALSDTGQIDIAEIQAGAALRNAELDGDELVEAALFLCYYIGWPIGTQLNMMIGEVIKRHEASTGA